MKSLTNFFALVSLITVPGLALASEQNVKILDLTNHWVGFFAIGIFRLAYLLVMAEEFTHHRAHVPQAARRTFTRQKPA